VALSVPSFGRTSGTGAGPLEAISVRRQPHELGENSSPARFLKFGNGAFYSP
jgi:hypothetical protein